MMSSDSSVSRKILLTTALGAAGALIGAGVYAYYKFEQEMRAKDTRNSLSLLEKELQALSLPAKKYKERMKSKDKEDQSKSSANHSRRLTMDSEDDYYTPLESDDEYHTAMNSENEWDSDCEDASAAEFFKEVDSLLDGGDDDQLNAFNLLLKNKVEYSDNPDYLWRLAKAHQIRAVVAGYQGDMEAKKKYILEGLGYAEKALSINDQSANANKWFAILTGMEGELLPVKQKIQKAYVFQKYLLAALSITDSDYSLHYLLGRFKYEVGNTSWLEKKIAASFLEAIPDYTIGDAIPHLQRAEKLCPRPWKENRLLLAKCYIGEYDYVKAMEWLDSAKEIQSRTKMDIICDREIDLLINKYQSYRK